MNIIETKVRDYLVSYNIYPFSVLYIKELRILKISFFLNDDISEFLDISGFKNMCDNFGYKLYSETNTILISKTYLTNFLRNVGCDGLY